jgi:CheY-like chemotaxis protein/two-component sensor histidine kinase
LTSDSPSGTRQAVLNHPDMMAHMAHELRTPLNSILTLSRLLARDSNLTPDQVASLTMIHDSGSELLYLVNDMLDLAKLDAGHMRTVASAVDLERLVHRIRRQFQPLAEAKGVVCTIEVDAAVPALWITDEQKFVQILRNLIANALRFTSSGGQVQVRLACDTATSMLVVEVADTGIGIPAEQLDRIFEAFHQAHSRHGGTGLGLTISRQFAQLLGGDIAVVSTCGVGSRFTFTLPELSHEGSGLVTPSDDTEALPSSVPSSAVPRPHARIPDPTDTERNPPAPEWLQTTRGKRIRLLIMDYDVRNAFLLARMLHTRIESITLAQDCQKVENYLANHEGVDLLLIVDRPATVDTPALLRTLRERPTSAHTSILVLTETQDDLRAASCLAAGADRCLPLPNPAANPWEQLEPLLETLPWCP